LDIVGHEKNDETSGIKNLKNLPGKIGIDHEKTV